jgi:hypothetical protein
LPAQPNYGLVEIAHGISNGGVHPFLVRARQQDIGPLPYGVDQRESLLSWREIDHADDSRRSLKRHGIRVQPHADPDAGAVRARRRGSSTPASIVTAPPRCARRDGSLEIAVQRINLTAKWTQPHPSQHTVTGSSCLIRTESRGSGTGEAQLRRTRSRANGSRQRWALVPLRLRRSPREIDEAVASPGDRRTWSTWKVSRRFITAKAYSNHLFIHATIADMVANGRVSRCRSRS